MSEPHVVKVVKTPPAVVRVVDERPVVKVGALGLRGQPGPAGPPGGAAPVRESLTGQVDGTNTNFATAGPFNAGSTSVYLNGLLLDTADYIEAVASVILSDAPLPGDRLTIVYAAS